MAYSGYGAPSPADIEAMKNPKTVNASGGGGGNYFGMDRNSFLDHLYNNIDSNVSKDQWNAWLDENGGANFDPKCPKTHPFKTNGFTADGKQLSQCVEKPDNCPEGMVASHTDKSGKRICAEADANGNIIGGPGGGGPGGGGQGNPYGWEDKDIDLLKDKFRQRMNADAGTLFAETGMAGDLSATADSFDQALMQDETMRNNPALAAQMKARMKADAMNQANAGIQGMRREAEGNLGSLSQGREGNSLSAWEAAMQNATNRYGIDQSTGLGWANLGNNKAQFESELGYKNRALDTSNAQWDKNFANQQQQYKDQQNAAKWGNIAQVGGKVAGGLGGAISGWGNKNSGSTLGKIAKIGGSLLGFFSDERLKEKIKPHKAGLKELKKLKPISYKYKKDAPEEVAGQKATSFSAQEVEKVLPKVVKKVKTKKYKDTRMIDMAKILATSVNAVKELDAKVTKLQGGKK